MLQSIRARCISGKLLNSIRLTQQVYYIALLGPNRSEQTTTSDSVSMPSFDDRTRAKLSNDLRISAESHARHIAFGLSNLGYYAVIVLPVLAFTSII